MLDIKSSRLYLGGLPEFVGVEEISRYLSGYGKIVEAKIQAGYGFVQFEREKDASDVVETFRDELFLGSRVSVEFAHPLRDARKASSKESKRTPEILQRHPVLISNMAPGTCWQELKDFGRQAGGFVAFCNIDKRHNGSGFLEYTSRDAARRAVRKLNGLSLRGQKVKLSMRDDENNRKTKTRHRSRSRSPIRRLTIKERRSDGALDNTTNHDEGHRIDQGRPRESHTHKCLPRVSTRSSRTESHTADVPTYYQPQERSYNSITTSKTDPYYDEADPYTPHEPKFSHKPTQYALDLASPFAEAREPEPQYETQYDQYLRERYRYDWHNTYRPDLQAYHDRR